jgi:putative two-component system response regulator
MMANILVVDDERSIRSTFEIFLKKEGHVVFLAEEVNSAKEIIVKHEIDLVITDIIMPKHTGIELLTEIKSKKPDVPVIIMTGEPTVETAKDAVRYAANDYLIKPVSKADLLRSIKYALEKKKLIDDKTNLEIENKKYRENLESMVNMKTQALQKAINGTVETIVKILEKKDPYTAGHERRVGDLSLAIAKKLNLSEEQQKQMYFAGYLHDIGKLLIPSEILSKPGKLTEGEFCVIKEHVRNGYELTKGMELSWPISDIIMQHHERLNGSGYPKGIKADEIEIGARILAVSDVIEAMTSHRPYRPGMGIEIALDEIESNAGILYDIDVAKAAIELFNIDEFEYSTGTHSLLI